jgi:hypothetical protein
MVIIERGPAGVACAVISSVAAYLSVSPWLYSHAGRALGAGFDWCQPPAGQRPIWRDEDCETDTAPDPLGASQTAPAFAGTSTSAPIAGRRAAHVQRVAYGRGGANS